MCIFLHIFVPSLHSRSTEDDFKCGSKCFQHGTFVTEDVIIEFVTGHVNSGNMSN